MGKIFIVDAEWKADSKVFIVDAEWKADSKEFVVNAEWKADEKVFIVDAEWKADRKVFLVDAEWKSKTNSSFFGSTFSASSNTDSGASSKMSSSNYQSTSTSSSSGCFGNLIKWIVFIIIIGVGLNYFGITDNLLSDSSEPVEFRVIADSLNMRAEPNTNSQVVTIIPRDSIVRQLNDSVHEVGNDTWIYVSNSIDSGWVNKEYVEVK
jgi:hypothetical protein